MNNFFKNKKYFTLVWPLLIFILLISACEAKRDNPHDPENNPTSIKNNTRLSSLDFSAGELEPSFDPNTNNYTLNIEKNIETITIFYQTENSDALTFLFDYNSSESITNPINLNEIGEKIRIEVSYLNPFLYTSTNEYYIQINRVLNSEAKLASLSCPDGVLSPNFDPEETSYTLIIENNFSPISLYYETENSTATTEIFSNESSISPDYIYLEMTETKNITITVTAENGLTTKDYNITAYHKKILFDNNINATYLKSSNSDPHDLFGSSIAISNNTLVVGAYGESSLSKGEPENNDYEYAGATYVFVKSGDAWVEQAYLKAPNPYSRGFFGAKVAIDGDVIVVGARGESGDAGRAYVFTRSDGQWDEGTQLQGSNTESDDFFGSSVAIRGETIVIGAVLESSQATGVNDYANKDDNSNLACGATYVFVKKNGLWEEQAYLKPFSSQNVVHFGTAVAIDNETIVVGASGENDYQGAAYVFYRSNNQWFEQAYLSALNGDQHDFFGISVSICSDLIAIGAIGESSSATEINVHSNNNEANDSGAVYIFLKNGSNWTQEAYLKPSNSISGNHFGDSLTLLENNLLVGAPYEGSKATGINGEKNNQQSTASGAAYLFSRINGTWIERDYFKATNNDPYDEFGRSLTFDSIDQLIIGSYCESSNASSINGDQNNNGAESSGAVYIYEKK